MRIEEAAWIAAQDMPSPVLELGSSTAHFRTISQPHIDAMIHAPLRQKGIRVFHADLKAAPGVDIVGDFSDPEVTAELQAVRARTVLCSNMFEHVLDRAALARICDSCLEPGGTLIVTVPYSYPVHHDPVDTYYRPSPASLAELFPSYRVIKAEVVTSKTYFQELWAADTNWPLWALKSAWRLIPIWRGLKTYTHMNHRMLWLFRPYKVSCVALRKPD